MTVLRQSPRAGSFAHATALQGTRRLLQTPRQARSDTKQPRLKVVCSRRYFLSTCSLLAFPIQRQLYPRKEKPYSGGCQPPSLQIRNCSVQGLLITSERASSCFCSLVPDFLQPKAQQCLGRQVIYKTGHPILVKKVRKRSRLAGVVALVDGLFVACLPTRSFKHLADLFADIWDLPPRLKARVRGLPTARPCFGISASAPSLWRYDPGNLAKHKFRTNFAQRLLQQLRGCSGQRQPC